jgi:hypothetical protein
MLTSLKGCISLVAFYIYYGKKRKANLVVAEAAKDPNKKKLIKLDVPFTSEEKEYVFEKVKFDVL